MVYMWLAIIILLAIVELMTSNLVTIWFSISGLLSLIVTLIFNNFALELSIFILLGIILMITTRPVLKKVLKENSDMK